MAHLFAFENFFELPFDPLDRDVSHSPSVSELVAGPEHGSRRLSGSLEIVAWIRHYQYAVSSVFLLL